MKWPFARKRTVNDLSASELDTERIRLEEEERRVLTKIQKAEDEKKRLFEQGVKQTTPREKVVVARKIKELDEQAREHDTRANMISKQLRVVNRLTAIQRNKGKLKESGVWSLIGSMSPEELERMLTENVVGETADRERVQALLDIIAADPRATQTLEEDEDVLRLVEKMEQASESGAIEEKYAELKQVLEKGGRDTE